ncbi:MAG: T9SS type A sorting domain-containing protein, partial [Ginsengibacter sp.]
FLYKTGPAETQFRITIKNNAAGGGGNDWVLDDIKLATCYPNLIMNPNDTATACAGSPVLLSDTVKSYFNNYVNWCWEKSGDGINWSSAGVCGTKAPVLVNGLWQYFVDTTFNSIAADSGKYFRLKVATTFPNLSNPSCAVDNSQKIFLKIFNTGCSLLNAGSIAFYGNIINDKAILKWTSQSDQDIKEYEVEKSIDGIKFLQVGIITANNINGATYTFPDPETVASMAYYRVKLISKSNNNNVYSKIISLYNKNALLKVSVVNPFKSNLRIDIFSPKEGDINFILFDMFGKMVIKKTLHLSEGNSQAILSDVDYLPSGVYFLRTVCNNTVVQNKLFKTE